MKEKMEKQNLQLKNMELAKGLNEQFLFLINQNADLKNKMQNASDKETKMIEKLIKRNEQEMETIVNDI